MTTVCLPAVCDRAAARALHLDIRDAIGDTPLSIDASKVEKIGQSMLQILVSAAGSEAGITIDGPSQSVIAALSIADLDEQLKEELNQESAA